MSRLSVALLGVFLFVPSAAVPAGECLDLFGGLERLLSPPGSGRCCEPAPRLCCPAPAEAAPSASAAESAPPPPNPGGQPRVDTHVCVVAEIPGPPGFRMYYWVYCPSNLPTWMPGDFDNPHGDCNDPPSNDHCFALDPTSAPAAAAKALPARAALKKKADPFCMSRKMKPREKLEEPSKSPIETEYVFGPVFVRFCAGGKWIYAQLWVLRITNTTTMQSFYAYQGYQIDHCLLGAGDRVIDVGCPTVVPGQKCWAKLDFGDSTFDVFTHDHMN